MENVFKDQLSFRIKKDQHPIINMLAPQLTGKAKPAQNEFFNAILHRAALNTPAPAPGSEELTAQIQALTIQVNTLQQQNQDLQQAADQYQPPTQENENNILVEFEPADLYFINKMIQAAQRKVKEITITPAVYIRAMLRGLYESGHIYASITFSDGEINRTRKQLNQAPANE